MKKVLMHKITALVCAFAICVTCMVSSISAGAEGVAKLSLSPVIAKAGENADVNLTVSNFSDVAGAQIFINIGTELEFVSLSSDLFELEQDTDYSVTDQGIVKLVLTGEKNELDNSKIDGIISSDADTNILKLTVKVPEGAEADNVYNIVILTADNQEAGNSATETRLAKDDKDLLTFQTVDGSVTVESSEITYNVATQIKAGASRLVEPWGIKYTAEFTGTDADKIVEKGMIMVHQKDYQESFTSDPSLMLDFEKAYIFTDDSADETYKLKLDSATGRYTALLTDGIKTQNMGDLVYVVSYAKMPNGEYIFGEVKNNSMERILTNNSTKSTVSEEEKAVCVDMLALYNAAVDHFDGLDIDNLTKNDVVATRGSDCQAAPSYSNTDTDKEKLAIKAGASRLVEPWGIKYTAAFYESSFTQAISQRGVAIISSVDFDSSFNANPDLMRTNANSYVFTDTDNTLNFSENNSDGSARYTALLTQDVYVYNINTSYYVVPFVVLEDGSYVYGEVKSNSMNTIVTNNSAKPTVSATEKNVGSAMQNLYTSVCAYYEVVGWPSFIRK